jgi:hypothetical protein
MIERYQVRKMFTYHRPQGDQQERYDRINEAAYEFACVILDNTKSCAEQTLAIRDVQRARMMANAGVALGDQENESDVQQAGA